MHKPPNNACCIQLHHPPTATPALTHTEDRDSFYTMHRPRELLALSPELFAGAIILVRTADSTSSSVSSTIPSCSPGQLFIVECPMLSKSLGIYSSSRCASSAQQPMRSSAHRRSCPSACSELGEGHYANPLSVTTASDAVGGAVTTCEAQV